jgi:hypothetical protein
MGNGRVGIQEGRLALQRRLENGARPTKDLRRETGVKLWKKGPNCGSWANFALDVFRLVLYQRDQAFWAEYRQRIANDVPGRFSTRVMVTATVPRVHADQFRFTFQWLLDYWAARLTSTGEIPELALAAGNARAPQPPTSARRKPRPVCFPSPDDLRWDEVTLVFTSDSAIRVQAREKRTVYTFCQMGFQDARSGDIPDDQWKTLRSFAVRDQEEFQELASRVRPDMNLKKQVSVIRKRLQAIFGIDDDPFHPYRKSKAYRPKFRVLDNALSEALRRKNQEEDD